MTILDEQIEIVVVGDADRYLTLFPEDRDSFKEAINTWRVIRNHIAAVWDEVADIRHQKDFSSRVKGLPYARILFMAQRGRLGLDEAISAQKQEFLVELYKQMSESATVYNKEHNNEYQSE